MKLALIASTLALTFSSAGYAAATGTVVFDMPTGTALSTDSIPVYLTLTLDADSPAITTDASGQVTSGLTDADVAAAGYDPAVYTNRIVNNAFECSGTFTDGCGSTASGAYNFQFNFDPGSLVGPSNFDLESGGSFTYLFGTFVPNGGAAPAGIYTFFNAIPEFEITNSDFSQVQFIDIASTCQDHSASCAFTRTVVGASAAPEPASWAMMLGGFGAIGGAMRSRRKAAVSFG